TTSRLRLIFRSRRRSLPRISITECITIVCHYMSLLRSSNTDIIGMYPLTSLRAFYCIYLTVFICSVALYCLRLRKFVGKFHRRFLFLPHQLIQRLPALPATRAADCNPAATLHVS